MTDVNPHVIAVRMRQRRISPDEAEGTLLSPSADIAKLSSAMSDGLVVSVKLSDSSDQLYKLDVAVSIAEPGHKKYSQTTAELEMIKDIRAILDKREATIRELIDSDKKSSSS